MPSCSDALPSGEIHERSLKPEEEKEEQEEEEEEEEEDEDVDFNPFLKETLSQEASSSLSSEIDGLDGHVVNSEASVDTNVSKPTAKEQSCTTTTAVDSDHGEEGIILQTSALISQSETIKEKQCDLTSEIDGHRSRIRESSNTTKSRSPVIDIDNEDAICMRTRARYSLASFSLDELETFLQESDDDDFQNADDEEEYKKFLAAVLQGGDADGLSTHENESLDDEDEDNDMDFEIELEELLESDVDENAVVKTRMEYGGAGRRPETRQNKRQKVSAHCQKKASGQVKRPLRPILPNWLNGPPASGTASMPESTLSVQSSASGYGLVNGFTPHQIGQLHCLIYEHVQLLIQVFSLSVLEPSQKHIASQVQSLLFEMLHKRDQVLSLKKAPYPSICFTPSYFFTSVSNGVSKFSTGQCNIQSASTQDAQNVCLPQSNQSCSEALTRQRSFQDNVGCFWVPLVRGPVQSILDVSPLNLVRRYVDDIHSAAEEFRKRYFESGHYSPVEKECLFPFSSSHAEANSEVSSGTKSRPVNTVSDSPGQQRPKKTLAAMLVESTKKQSIALVPKEVATLTQRFLPLFNPVLFPHKSPPAAVVNRILFTDSEDELLALGIMEYNTDWKAIQQRFLPCKSKHQIFVRQKNRCSSKAPENPIKAVRRMKTSPLTEEEIAFIQEGLKIYKFDWMLVWRCIVPHRDPSLLPRQWRSACGTQKSYKLDASKREKRRLYESNRRKLKASASESFQAISDKEDCEANVAGSENCMDYTVVPYVHQAFLADWRPETSTPTYSERISSTSGEGYLAHDYGLCGKAQHQNGNQPSFPSVPKLAQPFHTTPDLRSCIEGAPSAVKPRHPVSEVTSTSKYYCRPYRARRRVNNAHLVKLAPGLPPVNLPPSVRVVSETAFKGFQGGTSKVYPAGSGVTACRKDNSVSQTPHCEKKLRTINPLEGTRRVLKDTVTGSQLEVSGTVEGRPAVAENGTCSGLQLHPLLFQVTEDGSVPYYPLKFSSGTSSSISLFSGTHSRLNLSLFQNSQQQSHIACSNKCLKSKDSTLRSDGIDFHPLLQKSNDTKSRTSFGAIQTESLGNDVPAIANRSFDLNDKSYELDSEINLIDKSNKLDLNVPASTCGLAQSVLPSIVPNDNFARYDLDDIGDQSHPEIVMEQEELSDSEEDIEEHVEFECEEMADSEGEDGSDCEQTPEVQNKEVPTSEENVTKYTTSMEKPCEPGYNSDAQGDCSLHTNDTSTLNIALIGEGKDDKSISSWLCLDSSNTADDPMVQDLNLGPGVFSKPRKPRKRSGKWNASLKIGLNVERSSQDDNHKDG
ncbi:hypothetical protein Lal_00038844 [Lupinus albus]|uniref:Putative transcription factor MYB-HB-like family n=1 Tax=Lupinus albus TaxID=3870 RepID=A0A6A4NKZ0_LUPAL|nr:putative transcription factor MYB-HB-like family [Lupinus albus]KAF1882199.1 hypothetical protein Lal_00038844 [Lupinus albus]